MIVLYAALVQEATVIPPSKKRGKYIYPDVRPPLRDSDTIRVYHGANDLRDVYRIFKRGLSGQERADRRYSYESNNNPKGLFVTISLDIAKYFASYILEIHTKVSDLEAPVWPGRGYTVQGQMAEYFDGDEDREKKRLQDREEAKKSEYESIRNSDRPELARMLYQDSEQQALFIGNLDNNSIRAIWVNNTPNRSGEYSEYTRMTPKEFLKKFPQEQEKAYDSKMYAHRVFKPREKFDLDEFANRLLADYNSTAKNYRMTREEILGTLSGLGKRELLTYIWPHQLDDALAQLEEFQSSIQ